ncbi:MAG: cytidylate kinase-like family protein [Chloroflexota bacterium]
MPVITIARQFGAGARVVGRMVADILQIDYVDRQLIEEAAHRLGASPEVIARLDERPKPLGQRISRLLQTFLEKSAVAGGAGDPFLGPTGMEMLLSRSYPESGEPATAESQEIDDRRFLDIIRTVITELATAGNVVIIGRGGQLVLREKPNVLRVYMLAPFDDRARRVMEVEGIGRKEAEKLTTEIDRQRASFTKKFFKEDISNPLLYHLAINTGMMPLPEAARLIADAATAMEQGDRYKPTSSKLIRTLQQKWAGILRNTGLSKPT